MNAFLHWAESNISLNQVASATLTALRVTRLDFQVGELYPVQGLVDGYNADDIIELRACRGEINLPAAYTRETDMELSPFNAAFTSVDTDGSFRFEGLEQGVYSILLVVRPQSANTEQEFLAGTRWSSAVITVPAANDIVLRMP